MRFYAIFFLFFYFSSIISAEIDTVSAILLPINVSLPEGKRINLSVDIPEQFQPLQSIQQSIKSGFSEFIPKQDKDPYKWSQIITTQAIPGKGITADFMKDKIKKGILQDGKNIKIIEESTEKKQLYTHSKLTMLYSHKGRQELMHLEYFSGPYDCSGIQYSIALSEKLSQEKALHRIKEFVKNYTNIFNF